MRRLVEEFRITIAKNRYKATLERLDLVALRERHHRFLFTRATSKVTLLLARTEQVSSVSQGRISYNRLKNGRVRSIGRVRSMKSEKIPLLKQLESTGRNE